MVRFSEKQISGYFKAAYCRPGALFGGTRANDDYNIQTYGITNAEFRAMHSFLQDAFGTCPPSSVSLRKALRKALRNA